jgi:hypothetical protein
MFYTTHAKAKTDRNWRKIPASVTAGRVTKTPEGIACPGRKLATTFSQSKELLIEKSFPHEDVREFWRSFGKYAHYRGCYVFGRRAGKGFTPG